MLGLGPGGDVALAPLGIERVTPLRACRDAVRIVRAVCRGEATDGYDPPPHAFVAPDLPVYIGARGERFNRFASEAADGVFVAGVAPSLFDELVGWARSVRPSRSLYVARVSTTTPSSESTDGSAPLNGRGARAGRAFLRLSGPRCPSAGRRDGLASLDDERLDHVPCRWDAPLANPPDPSRQRRFPLADDMTRAIDGAAEAFATVTSEVAA